MYIIPYCFKNLLYELRSCSVNDFRHPLCVLLSECGNSCVNDFRCPYVFFWVNVQVALSIYWGNHMCSAEFMCQWFWATLCSAEWMWKLLCQWFRCPYVFCWVNMEVPVSMILGNPMFFWVNVEVACSMTVGALLCVVLSETGSFSVNDFRCP